MPYEIRAMSTTEILDTALRLVRDHFLLLVGLFLLINLPTALIVEYLQPDLPAAGEEVSAGQSVDLINSGIMMMLALAAVFAILYPIVYVAALCVIVDQYRGQEIGFGQALRYAVASFRSMMPTWMLTSLLVGLGSIALVIPGVYLFFAFYLVWPVMIVEKIFGRQAIRRSRFLMKGNFGRAFAITVIAALVYFVIGGGVQGMLRMVPVVGFLVGPLIESVGGAYWSAAIAVLYFDIRCRKEGFDIEHLAGMVERQGAAAAVNA